jgi:hypothetical protein
MRWMSLGEKANGPKNNFILSYPPFRAVSREKERSIIWLGLEDPIRFTLSLLIDKGTYLMDK